MRLVDPSVHLIGRPSIEPEGIIDYLEAVDGVAWWDKMEPIIEWREALDGGPDKVSEGEALIEFAAKLCYRAWEPGLNPNVTRVRNDTRDYFANILSSGHGSVLEHGFYVFVFHDVSRVFTHELVRHRAGTSISQESMRFVRLTDIPFWLPDWAKADPWIMERGSKVIGDLEKFQAEMAEHFRLDDPDVPFAEKKAKTSFMRRFAPDGVATSIVWGGNVRSIRHLIEMRTSEHAEEEIIHVVDKVAEIMVREAPHAFQDFSYQGDGHWSSENKKV